MYQLASLNGKHRLINNTVGTTKQNYYITHNKKTGLDQVLH